MEIPQVSPTPPPRLAGLPQMDPGVKGFRVDFSDLARSQKIYDIPADGFIAAAGAGGVFGKVLTNASDTVSQLAQEHHASVNRRKILDAETTLKAGAQRIARLASGEPDTLKWSGLAKQEAEKIKSQVLSADLSPYARDEITALYTRWENDTVRDTGHAAAVTAFTQEARTLNGRRVQAAESGDYALATSTAEDAHRRGLISDAERARWEADTARARLAADRRAEEDRRGAARARTQAAIQENPRAWLAADGARRPAWMPTEVHAAGLFQARETIRGLQVAAGEDLYRRLQLPPGDPDRIAVPEQIDAFLPHSEDLTPALREMARGRLAALRDPGHRADVQARAPEIASALWSGVRAYDPDASPVEEYFGLKGSIQDLPAEDQKDLLGSLEARRHRVVVKDQDPRLALGESILHRLLQQGGFGEYMDRGTAPGQSAPAVNAELWSEALAAKAAAGGSFRRWLERHPGATEDEVKRRVWNEQSSYTLSSVFDALEQVLRPASSAAIPVPPLPVKEPAAPPGGSGHDTSGSLFPHEASPPVPGTEDRAGAQIPSPSAR